MLKVEHKYKVTCALLNKGILIERVAYITSKDRVEDMDVESIQSAINDYLEIDDSKIEAIIIKEIALVSKVLMCGNVQICPAKKLKRQD